MDLSQIPIQKYLDSTIELIANFMPKITFAILTLIVGWFIIKWVNKIINEALNHGRLDKAVRSFLSSLINIGLKIVLLVIVASMLGVQTSSLVALLGAAGLAIGLALQGSLANFAGGVLILIFKPFRIGDHIEAQGFSGVVESIQIFNTTLDTFDNQRIVIPNGKLSNDSIRNYTTNRIRRVDFDLNVAYEEDLTNVRKVLLSIAKKEVRHLSNHEPQVILKSLGDSAVEVSLRFWVKTKDYWPTYYENIEVIKNTFDKNNIKFPYPQREVHTITSASVD